MYVPQERSQDLPLQNTSQLKLAHLRLNHSITQVGPHHVHEVRFHPHTNQMLTVLKAFRTSTVTITQNRRVPHVPPFAPLAYSCASILRLRQVPEPPNVSPQSLGQHYYSCPSHSPGRWAYISTHAIPLIPLSIHFVTILCPSPHTFFAYSLPRLFFRLLYH